MDIKEFEEQMLSGTITDFEPFFDLSVEELDEIGEPYNFSATEARWILAKNGIELERCLECDGNFLISELVQAGLYPERYEEWRERGPVAAEWFIGEGLFLDDYIKSKDPDVRRFVMRKDIRYCLKRMAYVEDGWNIHSAILSHSEPTLEVLEAYFEAPWSKVYNNDSIKLKYQALTTPSDALARTMTLEQLYDAGHPAWTKGFCAMEIGILCEADEILKKIGYKNYTRHLFDALNSNWDMALGSYAQYVARYCIDSLTAQKH